MKVFGVVMRETYPPVTAVVRVTDICNLSCIYCSAEVNKPMGIMSTETVKNLIKSLYQYNSTNNNSISRIIWHGGEPLIVGKSFYEFAVECEKEYPNHKFSNSIMTNGTLLNDEFLDFFAENNFRVGFSLDGIPETHNHNRPYKDGNLSFDTIRKNMEKARNRGVGGSGFLCVVNRNTVNHLLEIYKMMKREKLSGKFNPQLNIGRATKHKDSGISPEQYAIAMVELFDTWFFDDSKPTVEIEPFIQYIRGSKSYKSLVKKTVSNMSIKELYFGNSNNVNLSFIENKVCSMKNNCFFTFIGVDPSGNVSTCNRFLGNSEFIYGNMNVNSLEELLRKPRTKFANEMKTRAINGVEDCVGCEFSDDCRGGCANSAYISNGTVLSKDGFCISTKLILKHINDVLLTNTFFAEG
jgi:uncharacterized protein